MSGSSAVDAIAEALERHGMFRIVGKVTWRRPNGYGRKCVGCGFLTTTDAERVQHRSDVVVAAIRAMSPEQLADLTEGRVEARFTDEGLLHLQREQERRVVTPWQPVEEEA